MGRMIEKALDLCFVMDLNPYKEDDALRSTFILRMNMLLLCLGAMGHGSYVSVYLLDGPFEDTFARRAESNWDNIPAMKHWYFDSLCPLKDCPTHHSAALFERSENEVCGAEEKEPYISFETHSFYVTATPVTSCCQDEPVYHEDAFRHLYLLGMDEDEAYMSAQNCGCDDFFLYPLDDDSLDECFDTLFQAVTAVYRNYTGSVLEMDGYEERYGVLLS